MAAFRLALSSALVNFVLLVSCFSVLFDTAAGIFGEGLKRAEKQLLLDLHNYHRASVSAAGMRRLVRGLY